MKVLSAKNKANHVLKFIKDLEDSTLSSVSLPFLLLFFLNTVNMLLLKLTPGKFDVKS